MKIILATDSRGVHGTTQMDPLHPENNSWTNLLMKKYPQHEYINRRAGWGDLRPMTSLHDNDPWIRQFPDNHFDIIYLHVGVHTGIDYWTPPLFKAHLKHHYTDEGLQFDNGGKFVYIHRETEKTFFDLLKQKCKKVVWFGYHSLARLNPHLRKEREWQPTYAVLGQMQNAVWSKLATHYVDVPQDEAWVDKYCREDFFHYNGEGTQYFMERAETFL